ncbi:hypothetical protein SORBI_3002G028632 [Sorghum bicolor]|uniref:DUF4220 domain-containing protein n=1 Tax=Sorghum bicolor TaxID=4558 RepID=A0A1W0W235_SORBI|nr:hypothetical protein SORBI_3002G028632 [Sorghum bicolor]
MEPSSNSKQDGAVNMTRAMEALSPWLNHPRKTIIQMEGLVVAAAALLLLQLILGSCKRRWHNSFLKYGLQVCNGIMFPLTVYTLGTMQSSPIKNSSYPVCAGFLIMASAGTTAVRQYDFDGSFFYKMYIQVPCELFRDLFYITMFVLLLDPDTEIRKVFSLEEINGTASSYCVSGLVTVVFFTKAIESYVLVVFGYHKKGIVLATTMLSRRRQDVEENGNDGACDNSDPLNMKGCNYIVRYGRLISIDHIWCCCVINSAGYGKALKDLCLSCALFGQLVRQRYFGEVYLNPMIPTNHDFVFKKMLPPQGDFKRAFRIIEIFSVLIVGVFAIRKSLVLETPNPIIEVQISRADYIITLLVLSIALLVELVQAAFYLASNWAQVSLACMHVKKHWFEPNAYIFGKFICLLRWIMISTKLRNKIDQHSLIFAPKQQPDPVEVSDAVKEAIAISLRLTYANNLTVNEKESVMVRNEILGEYSWALKDLSQLEVMLIWHIATEYCDAISDDPSDGNGTTPSSNRRGAHLFGYVLQLLRPNPRRNNIARDGDRGVAVHLSRYCAYLIGSVPELVPYHQAYIREVTEKVREEGDELFGSCIHSWERYYKMKNLQGTEEGDNPTTVFKKGVKLGKQLEEMTDGDRWFVMQDFWAKKIIHAADLHYTTKQHMQQLENGGEFLTHIWALLAHAGILDRDKDQQGQGVQVTQVATNLSSSAPSSQAEIV